jgi:hypothetical protein
MLDRLSFIQDRSRCDGPCFGVAICTMQQRSGGKAVRCLGRWCPDGLPGSTVYSKCYYGPTADLYAGGRRSMVPACKLLGSWLVVPGHDGKSGTWRLSTSASNLGSQNMLLINGVASVIFSGRVGKVSPFRNCSSILQGHHI